MKRFALSLIALVVFASITNSGETGCDCQLPANLKVQIAIPSLNVNKTYALTGGPVVWTATSSSDVVRSIDFVCFTSAQIPKGTYMLRIVAASSTRIEYSVPMKASSCIPLSIDGSTVEVTAKVTK